jgi:hypothetical protein
MRKSPAERALRLAIAKLFQGKDTACILIFTLRMKNMLYRIAVSLGIVYDPGTAIQLPGEEQEAPQPRQRKSKPVAPPDAEVVPSAAGPMWFRQPDEKTFEFDKCDTGALRSKELSEEDIVQLELGGMDMTDKAIAKAAELKALWAKGMTNSQIEARYTGKRGYSLRTIKTFTVAFSKAECTSVQK